MASLTINLDQIAALRQVRKLREPDPAQAAVLAELSGADGIAVQFRRDRKYIRERDLYILREVVKTRLIVEIAPTEEMIGRMQEVKPWMVTFVADQPDSDTPVGGIDFNNAPIDFHDVVAQLKGLGVSTCFFIEAEPEAVKGAARAGADAVMINTGTYTGATAIDAAQEGLDAIDRVAQAAARSHLAVMAGRGISYRNATSLVELGFIEEFVVGHAVMSRAVLVGLDRAVREMKDLVQTDIQQST